MGRGAADQLNKLRHCDRCLDKRLGCGQEKPVCNRCSQTGISASSACHYTLDSKKRDLARKIYNKIKDPNVQSRCQKEFYDLLGDPSSMSSSTSKLPPGNTTATHILL
jgi:hypothetical protein